MLWLRGIVKDVGVGWRQSLVAMSPLWLVISLFIRRILDAMGLSVVTSAVL